MLHFTPGKKGGDTYIVSARMSHKHDANMVILQTAQTDSSNTVVGTKFTRPKDGVTADLFRLADLFRRNLYASGYVPVFKELSGFVPGVPFPLKTQHSALATVIWSGYSLN